MCQQFHIFQENLSGPFQLCTNSVQICQGNSTLVDHPGFNVKEQHRLGVFDTTHKGTTHRPAVNEDYGVLLGAFPG